MHSTESDPFVEPPFFDYTRLELAVAAAFLSLSVFLSALARVLS